MAKLVIILVASVSTYTLSRSSVLPNPPPQRSCAALKATGGASAEATAATLVGEANAKLFDAATLKVLGRWHAEPGPPLRRLAGGKGRRGQKLEKLRRTDRPTRRVPACDQGTGVEASWPEPLRRVSPSIPDGRRSHSEARRWRPWRRGSLRLGRRASCWSREVGRPRLRGH